MHVPVPRLTNQLYLHYHQQLGDLWREHEYVFSVVPMKRQRAIHDFFQPDNDLTATELLTHRRAISQIQPSLPARAGKDCRYLLRVHLAADRFAEGNIVKYIAAVKQFALPGSVFSRDSARKKVLEIRAVMRPEIDEHKLARALLMVAERQLHLEQLQEAA